MFRRTASLTSGGFSTIDVPGMCYHAHGINNQVVSARTLRRSGPSGHRMAIGFLTAGSPQSTFREHQTLFEGHQRCWSLFEYVTAGIAHGFLLSGGTFTTVDVPAVRPRRHTVSTQRGRSSGR
jgi:hypothetical protein